MIEDLKILDDNAVKKNMPEDYGPALEMIVNKIKAAQARAILAARFLRLVGRLLAPGRPPPALVWDHFDPPGADVGDIQGGGGDQSERLVALQEDESE